MNWGLTFHKRIDWKLSGFIDIAGAEGSGNEKSEQNILAQTQFTWVVNKELELGFEYQYWQNKYGIKGLNEKVPQFLAKWKI